MPRIRRGAVELENRRAVAVFHVEEVAALVSALNRGIDKLNHAARFVEGDALDCGYLLAFQVVEVDANTMGLFRAHGVRG